MNRKVNLLIILIIILLFSYKPALKNTKTNYKVNACYIPVKEGDFGKAERFMGSLLRYKKNPTKRNKAIKDSMSKFFKYGNYINLVNVNETWGKSDHVIFGQYTVKERGRGQVGYSINNIKYKDGFPVVCINSTIPVKAHVFSGAKEKINRAFLISETKHWPVKHPKIIKIKESICKGRNSEKEKVFGILDWMSKNVRRGEKPGTRYGTLKFLELGHGRCADYSDLFITLCRASGIPARQVMGVVYKRGGHAWCQIYLKGKGWVYINPPVRRLGVRNTFIPISISETGDMTFLFYSIPEITKKL